MPYISLLDKLKIIVTTGILRKFYTFIDLYNKTFMFILNIVKLFALTSISGKLLSLYRIKNIANLLKKASLCVTIRYQLRPNVLCMISHHNYLFLIHLVYTTYS